MTLFDTSSTCSFSAQEGKATWGVEKKQWKSGSSPVILAGEGLGAAVNRRLQGLTCHDVAVE